MGERRARRRPTAQRACADARAAVARARRGAAPAACLGGSRRFPPHPTILRVAAPPPLLGEAPPRPRAADCPPRAAAAPRGRAAAARAWSASSARARARRRARAAPRPRAPRRPWPRVRDRGGLQLGLLFSMVSCASIKSASRTRCCRRLAFALASLRTALKQSASS